MASNLVDQFLILGADRVSNRGALIIPSQLAFDQLLILENYLKPRSLVYLVDANSVLDTPLRHYLEKDGVTTLQFDQTTQAADLQKELQREINQNHLVIFVPGKSVTAPAPLTTIPSAVTKFLVETRVQVQALVVDRPHMSRASIEENDPDPGPVFSFAEALERESANLPNFLERLMEANEAAFKRRRLLGKHLGYAALQGLMKHGSNVSLIDGSDKSETGFDRVLAASLALSKLIKKRTDKKRVAVILPPGRAGFVANTAVLLANKVPVNLNFTASKHAIDSSIEQADLDLFITADRFREKVSSFSWPADDKTLLIEKALPNLKWKIVFWLLVSKGVSENKLAKMIGLPKVGGDEEAVLLFTSGSSGDPKGVILTHRNLLANINQFSSRLNLSRTDRVLGCLPLFHSFGCTVTTLFPLIEGYTTVTYPSPIDSSRLANLIEKHRVTLVLGTPTFLRGYLRKAKPEQFASVKLVVAGAEKLPPSMAESFQDKLGKEILEGYGLTETSPVSNVNIPDPTPDTDPNIPTIPAQRRGSVGQLLPGVAARITDPDTDMPLPLHQAGMIWLRGPNIFKGYLNQPEKSAEVLQGRWFKTGDIGRVDEDGFLYIEGRLSRFSKIGGEMVPHETVEAYLNNALRLTEDDERKLVVMGVPDQAKGETLVLLTTDHDLEFDALRKHLIGEGVPQLWVPRKSKIVEAIPMLASGKLDLKACQELASQA